MKNKIWFITLSIFLGLISTALAQIEVRLEDNTPVLSGSVVSMGNHSSLPARENQRWTIVNTGTEGIRISSIKFIDTEGVAYSTQVLNTGYSLVLGSVGSDELKLAAAESRNQTISFVANKEGRYQSTFQITYYLSGTGSTKAPEAMIYLVHLDALVKVIEPTPPPVDDGEPVPENMKQFFPTGFPTDDIRYHGGNLFKSETLGSFEVDQNNENRFLHQLLGPIVWSQDHTTSVVTLTSEWWGNLFTATPGVRTNLGFEFPYVKSEMTGNIYFVDVSASSVAPFYNHRVKSDGQDVGWQSAIGIDLISAENYYKAAETIIGQMQQQLAFLNEDHAELASMKVKVGSTNLEEKRSEAFNAFLTIDSLYGRFLWYRQRLILSPLWIERRGGNAEQIASAQAWVDAAENNLTSLSTELYASGQSVYYNKVESAFSSKVLEREAKRIAEEEEAARKAAEEEAARKAAEEAARKAAEEEAARKAAEEAEKGGGGSGSSGGSGGSGVVTHNWSVGWDCSGSAPSWARMSGTGTSGGRIVGDTSLIVSVGTFKGVLKSVEVKFDGNNDYSFSEMKNRISFEFAGGIEFWFTNRYAGLDGDEHHFYYTVWGTPTFESKGWLFDGPSGDCQFRYVVTDGSIRIVCKKKSDGSKLYDKTITSSHISLQNYEGIDMLVYNSIAWVDNLKIFYSSEE